MRFSSRLQASTGNLCILGRHTCIILKISMALTTIVTSTVFLFLAASQLPSATVSRQLILHTPSTIISKICFMVKWMTVLL